MFIRKPAALAVTILATGLVMTSPAWSQQRQAEAPEGVGQPRAADLERSLRFTEQALSRQIDEQMLFRRLEDLAVVDVVRYTGPPPRVVKVPNAPGAKNPVIIPAYTFLP